jgi:RND family efflux transporter MFP subunit
MPPRRRPVSLALAPLVALVACEPAPEAGDPPPRPIAWTTVEPAAPMETRTLSGVVAPVQRAELGFEVAGRIAAVAVEIGDRFASGDVLATLDTRTLRLTRDQRASELEEARATLAEAEAHFRRQERLFDEGWVAEAAFDAAKSARDTARSKVVTAAARLAIARENLEDATLRAPYAGVVAGRLAEPSERVGAGQTVLAVQGRDAGFEVRVAAPETLVDRLERGTDHAVRLPARPGLELAGRVADIGVQAAPGDAYPVTLALEPRRPDLRAGMTAEVTFALATDAIELASSAPAPATVAIPVTAFAAGDGDARVAFVFDEKSGTVARRSIVVSEVTGARARVGEGLAPGEIIAAKGVDFLRDGQAVTLLGRGPERYHP